MSALLSHLIKFLYASIPLQLGLAEVRLASMASLLSVNCIGYGQGWSEFASKWGRGVTMCHMPMYSHVKHIS